MFASKAGILRHSLSKKKSTHKYWIDGSHRRYIPQMDDMVLGVVTDTRGAEYVVDIGAAAPASLNNLAFEGATRKNRPQLKIGSLVYARVSLANKDMEPEISCLAAGGKADGFGPIEGGYMFKVSIGLARELLHPSCAVLNHLGRHLPFEIAVGLNGRVWINSFSVARINLITKAILQSECISDDQIKSLVEELFSNSKK